MNHIVLVIISLLVVLAGCGKSKQESSANRADESKKSAESVFDKDASPEEKKYLMAAKPFIYAIGNREYDEAYAQLSSHAKARMSLNQFDPASDEAAYALSEKNPLTDVTLEKFTELLGKVEELYGMPHEVKSAYVFSTDRDVLARRSKEQTGVIDSMFAIGAMPESVPADIRRASVRGQIFTRLSRAQLEAAAKEEGVRVEDLERDPDFAPYFNLKVVLVEEGGQLKVGYFEFLPPSIMD